MDRHALADFLRRRRERLQPAELGLPVGRRARRTPGLRREEVAWLTGMSTSYYERLEQARGPNPSAAVVAAMGRALRLGPDERRYLARLTGQEPVTDNRLERSAPSSVVRLVEHLVDQPTYVLNPIYDVLAWNRLAAALVADFETLPPAHRNLLRITFGADRPGRTPCRGTDAEAFLRQAVAELRAARVHYPEDPAVGALIDWLAERSPSFRRAWRDHEVTPRPSLGKHLAHPELGPIELDVQTLRVPDTELRVIIFSAEPGSDSDRALRTLRSGLSPRAGSPEVG